MSTFCTLLFKICVLFVEQWRIKLFFCLNFCVSGDFLKIKFKLKYFNNQVLLSQFYVIIPDKNILELIALIAVGFV